MSGIWEKLGAGGRGRGGGGAALVQIAREVVGRRRSLQGALNEARHPAVLDALHEEDFEALDTTVEKRTHSDPEFALVLARLVHAAARAKGFDRQIVDAALRLDSLLPADDPSREREKLLRDAYGAAQRDGYVLGGRLALARLGHRAFDAGDLERARVLFQQQLDLGPDADDSSAEVDAALVLADILRRDGDLPAAQTLYRRAGRSAQRLNHHRGVAEALTRQIELMDAKTGLDTLATLQRQALDAAQRTLDRGLQGRILLGLAETLLRQNQPAEAMVQLVTGLDVAREIGDLSLENRCLSLLVEAERRGGKLAPVAEHEAALLALEERLGNRAAAAEWAIRLGGTRLSLGRAEDAAEAFARALTLAEAVSDVRLEQRALGGIGVAQTALNRPVEALDHLMRALDLARRTGDTAHEAQWLGGIGQALWTFAQPDDAIQAINQAIAAARRVDDGELQAGMLTLLGKIHVAGRQPARAKECFHRAQDLYRRLNLVAEQVNVLDSLGGIAANAGQAAQAVALYEQALKLAAQTGDRAGAARLYARLGRLAQRRGDREAALDQFARSADLAQDIEQPALLGHALQLLGTAQDALGDPQATTTYRQALAIAEDLGDTAGEALLRLNLGTLLAGNGHRAEGLDHLRRARALADDLGPAGAQIADRARLALASVPEPDRRPPTADLSERDRDRPSRWSRPRRDDRAAFDDAVAREATLPPG